MYIKCSKRFKKIVATLLAITLISTTYFQNTVLAVPSFDGLLMGHELLTELRELGLGGIYLEEIPEETPKEIPEEEDKPEEAPEEIPEEEDKPGEAPEEMPEEEDKPEEAPEEMPEEEDKPEEAPEEMPEEEGKPEEAPEETPEQENIPEDGMESAVSRRIEYFSGVDDNYQIEQLPIETTTSGGIQILPEVLPELPPQINQQYRREILIGYVQELLGEQIISLDYTDMTDVEEEDLYSMLTEYQLWQIKMLNNSTQNFTDVGSLMAPVNLGGTSRLAVEPVRSDEELVQQDGLKLNKTSVWDEEKRTATITLEAYTTGTVESSTTVIPSDIVLVLDESGSMKDTYEKKEIQLSDLNPDKADRYTYKSKDNSSEYKVRYENSKWQYNKGKGNSKWTNIPNPLPSNAKLYETTTNKQALQDAAKEFIRNVEDNAKKNEVNHRIAIAAYASSNASDANTDFLEVATNADELVTKIDKLKTNGATRTDLGLEKARDYFTKDTSVTGQRNRVVIVFTDGVPTTNNTFSNPVANRAIAYSRILKAQTTESVSLSVDTVSGIGKETISGNGLGATVYSIGIFENANVEGTSDANKFMNYISTNYINAESMTKSGNPNPSKKYYLTARDTDGLNKIFEEIYNSIQRPTIVLGDNTIINDVISDYFRLDEDFKDSDVSIYTQDFTGGSIDTPSWGTKTPVISGVTAQGDKENNSVQITGFNFDENFIRVTDSGGREGKKLIIEFEVEPIEGFIGGNQVPTNGNASGIYNETGLVGHFERPTVDVGLRYDFIPNDQSIYITNVVEIPKNFIVKPSENTEKVFYQIGNTSYLLGDKRNDFVDIIYTVKDDQQQVVGTYTVAKGQSVGVWKDEENYEKLSYIQDANYTVECRITPSLQGEIPMKEIGKTANVYIYTPGISVEDRTIYLGEEVNEEMRSNIVEDEVTWAYRGQSTEVPVVTGTAPILTYEYVLATETTAPEEWWLERDTDFNVIVKVADTDITEKTVISNVAHTVMPSAPHDFTIEVKTCTLELIKKAGANTTIDSSENFIFEVTREGTAGEHSKFQDKYSEMQVVIKGANKVTITGLPIGTYTLEENQDWSWRYESDSTPKVTLTPNQDKDKDKAALTITNKLKNNKWLSFETIKTNLFNKTSGGR